METKYVKIQFDVELAKKITNGEVEGKVVTRDGQSVRIVCFDALRSDSLVVLITEGTIEKTYNYTPDGRVFINDEASLDLMLEVPEYMTFEDGDIVAFGGNNDHVGIFKSLNLKEKTFSSYATLTSKSLVFYEPAWRLINIHIATEEQRQRIVNALKSSEVPKAKECLKKLGIEEKPKYEFKPFDKVLVRDDDYEKWGINLFERYDGEERFPYMCLDQCFNQCIPYNEKTAHLLGTTENYK
jgi:hypothetical protein